MAYPGGGLRAVVDCGGLMMMMMIPGLRDPLKRETVYLATWATEGTGGVFSQ